MKLKRVSKSIHSEHDESSKDFRSNSDGTLRLDFIDFGAGSDRRAFFQVFFDWDDVEALIQAFANERHPSAMRAKEALILATAVENIIKNSN